MSNLWVPDGKAQFDFLIHDLSHPLYLFLHLSVEAELKRSCCTVVSDDYALKKNLQAFHTLVTGFMKNMSSFLD